LFVPAYGGKRGNSGRKTGRRRNGLQMLCGEKTAKGLRLRLCAPRSFGRRTFIRKT